MKSHEAMERCIGKNVVAVAKALRKSSSLVHKWKEPTTDFTDSGTLNPLDRLETIIRTAMFEGQSKEDALAPLLYLAHRFNLTIIPLPEIRPSMSDISRECHESIFDFGQYISAFSEAINDGSIAPLERRNIEVKGLQTIQHIAAVIQMAAEEN